MPYAEGRTFFDADSHLMETSDWLVGYADPAIRERLRPLQLGGAGRLAEQAVRDAEARRGDAGAAAALEGELMRAKGWKALGAVDPVERSRALDLLGFDRQLVFSTFAATQYEGKDLDLLYGGTTAHNRAITDFCSVDERLVPVASVPLADPERTERAVDEALELGAGAMLVPSAPPKETSPTHPEWDGLWGRLADAGIPFVNHVGGGARMLRRQFHANGKPPTTDFLGGGENIRSKDYMTLHMSPEVFLSCMVLDGVFERFPTLRGGCIEQGAMWVVPWLRRLDIAQDTFRRTEPALDLPLRPSEYVHRALKFTPFSTEPVGWLIEEAGEDLFLFSSDYPHPEGGRDPLGRFEASLGDASSGARERFYAGNFAELIGMAPVAA
jgi:predicted TIM-barrel fold metal-dependent hydrolase